MHPSLQEMIDSAKKIVVLTGAGISTDSGIPDFRSETGTWTMDHQREYYISKSFFNSDSELFWKNYKKIFRFDVLGDFLPNTGHFYLADLEQQGKEVRIYTQNADGLHQKAGSSKVFEVHGSLLTGTCPQCRTKYDLDFIQEQPTPRCSKDNAILEPGMVLFGDAIHYFQEAMQDLVQADLFLVLGTSLQVGPINELPRLAKHYQVPSVLINREATPLDFLFDRVFHESIGDSLKADTTQA